MSNYEYLEQAFTALYDKYNKLEMEYEGLMDEHEAVIEAYDEMCEYAGELEDEVADLRREDSICAACDECCCGCDDCDCDEDKPDECPYFDDCIEKFADIFAEEICPYCEFSAPEIRNIYYCDKPGKEKVIVIFDDNTKIIKEMVPGDSFDLNIGVALCIAEKIYGGKTKFHKMVKKIAGIKEKRNKIVETPENN